MQVVLRHHDADDVLVDESVEVASMSVAETYEGGRYRFDGHR